MRAAEANTTADGRHRRRSSNRDAVVAAVLGCYRVGDLHPSIDDIAERAGVSPRSVFRYFDDTDALVRTAIARQQDHLTPLYDHGATPDQQRSERVATFVAGRARLLEEMGHVGRVARSRAVNQPLLAKELHRIRAVLRHQVADLFAAELATVPGDDRAAVLGAIDVAASWEAWDLLRNDQGLSAAAAKRAMERSISGILDGASR